MTLTLRAPFQFLPLAAGPLLAGVLAAGAALAQPYGQPPPPYGAQGGQYGGQPWGRYGSPYGQPAQPAPQGYGGDVQSQLASLHAALQLNAGQEAAWRAFAAASGPDPQQQARERSAQQMLPGLTSPQRVDLSLAAMEADLDSMRERGRALKAFYASLTPAQQKIFDSQTLPRQQPEDGAYER